MISHLTLVLCCCTTWAYISSRVGTLFSSGWVAAINGWCHQMTTDEFQYSFRLQVLTDVSVFWGHQRDHILRTTGYAQFNSPSATPCTPINWAGAYVYVEASEVFARSNSETWTLSATSVQRILSKLWSSLLNGTFTNIAVTCENMTSLL